MKLAVLTLSTRYLLKVSPTRKQEGIKPTVHDGQGSND